jgi:hypothetical protein
MVVQFVQVLTAGVAFMLAVIACALLLVAAGSLWRAPRAALDVVCWLSAYVCAAIACSLAGLGLWWIPAATIGLGVSLVASRRLADFSAGARLMLVAYPLFTLFAAGWLGVFLVRVEMSEGTRLLLLVACGLVLLTVPATLVGQFGEWEGMGRRIWRRPRQPLTAAPGDRRPMVSLHVPTYAEPPELVIASLDALATLDYPNFEVLVIDNNTDDPRLWRPIEAHCLRLGARFHFFHVPVLAGAKAGAVNFALARTAPEAEIIGVLDSDYRAEPDFLARLVGFFDDARIGFVQTPHDYRDWQDSLYQRLCYWEYAYGVKNLLPTLNEHGAAYTIGTMCLIRRAALEAVGGWAEWCLTEDSELAIRLHAHGYAGIYLPTTFGRGLIPETFVEYKNQRFRWACGPVQQLRHHARLLAPAWFRDGSASALTATQRLHELSHGLGLLNSGLSLGATGLSVAIIASLLIRQEVVAVPLTLWGIVGGRLLIAAGMAWLTHRMVLGCSLREMLGAFVARSALSYTIATASIAGVLNRPTMWRRTNKFPMLPAGLRVLTGVWMELGLGVTAVVGGGAAIVVSADVSVLSLLAVGVVAQGLRFLAAPMLAILSERDLRRLQRSRAMVNKNAALAGGVWRPSLA